ncbi:hypothetical protein WA158_000451 [Blastocystis sp. Blastoise]
MPSIHLDRSINVVYIGFCCIIFLWTFFITSIPLWIRVSKQQTYLLTAFGAGLVVGTAFCVIIPESLEPACNCASSEGSNNILAPSFQKLGFAISFGFFVMILFESLSHRFHGHSHESGETAADCESLDKKDEGMHSPRHTIHNVSTKVYGLALHSIFDGISLASSYMSGNVNTVTIVFGAMMLHKMSSSFGIGTFLKASKLTFKSSFFYLLLLSICTPVSALLTALIAYYQSNFINSYYIPYFFAFSAGTFVHVGVSHLMNDFGEQLSILQMICMFIGLIIPYMLFVEH